MSFCLSSSIVLSCVLAYTCIEFNAQVGIHFEETLSSEGFFSKANESIEIVYSVAVAELPDMPQWMELLYHGNSAVIYGTPLTSNVGKTILNAVAWNKNTYETAVNDFNITITKGDFSATQYQIDFKIQNINIQDIIGRYKPFLNTVKTLIWSDAGYIVKCQSVAHRLNANSAPGETIGVYVIVGGRYAPPTIIDSLKRNCLDSDFVSTTNRNFLNKGYQIDWCALDRINSVSSEMTGNVYVDTEDVFYQPIIHTFESYKSHHQHLASDIAYVFIPVVIGIVCVVVLTFAFFCKSSVKSRTKQQEPINAKIRNNKQSQDGFTNSRPPVYQVPPRMKTRDTRF